MEGGGGTTIRQEVFCQTVLLLFGKETAFTKQGMQTQKHPCSLTYWKMLANIQETTQHNARIL